MMAKEFRYEVLSPVASEPRNSIKNDNKVKALSPPLADLAGKTICAMRHVFRADETFPIIEALLHEQFGDIKFIPNSVMPDLKVGNADERETLLSALQENGCDALLIGNAA